MYRKALDEFAFCDIVKAESLPMLLMEEFLYLAIYQPEGRQPLPLQIVRESELYRYIDNFGTKLWDCAFAAVAGEEVCGLAWCRLLDGATRGYGYVDDETPELSMAVRPQYRGCGMGTALLRTMVAYLRGQGCGQISLSVSKKNPARRLYAREGFCELAWRDEDVLMLYRFD